MALYWEEKSIRSAPTTRYYSWFLVNLLFKKWQKSSKISAGDVERIGWRWKKGSSQHWINRWVHLSVTDVSSSSWNEKINIHSITYIKKYSPVMLRHNMLDRVIAQLYGAVFPHGRGRRTSLTAVKKTKNNYAAQQMPLHVLLAFTTCPPWSLLSLHVFGALDSIWSVRWTHLSW